MAQLTRGPLPAGVYWRRRMMVLGTAVALVFAIGRLLTGSSDGSSGPEEALSPVGGSPTSNGAVTDRTAQVREKPRRDRTPKEPPLAEPSGPCADEDVAVTPEVKKAVAGGDVSLRFALRSIEAEACTWRVTHESLTLKITSGDDEVWSSRQCPASVRSSDVIVRQAVSTEVEVSWSGKRSSDTACSRGMQWAMPGWYHVTAAALGGEPADVQFELVAPEAEHITETVEPKPQRDQKDEPKRR